MAITKISITLPRTKTELVKEALNFYKQSLMNMGMSGKKLSQKIEELDDLVLISSSEIVVSIDKQEHDSFQKSHGREFPTFEE